MEIAETTTRFLAVKALVYIVTLLFTGITFDVAQVFDFVLILFCYLGGWMTSLMTTLVFFRGLNLRLISKRGIVGLSLVFVLVKSLITVLLKGVIFVFFWPTACSFLGNWNQFS